MAGSYNHIVTKKGNLRSNESFVQLIENLGDAYEMTEELFGMIWALATGGDTFPDEGTPEAQLEYSEAMKAIVEQARQDYKEGLVISRKVHRVAPNG